MNNPKPDEDRRLLLTTVFEPVHSAKFLYQTGDLRLNRSFSSYELSCMNGV